MTKLTPEVLKAAFPRITTAAAKMVAEFAPKAMAKFNITTPRRVSAFLAQCAHESGLFTARRENLNYSAEGLMRTWPKRFTSMGTALRYARKPEAIANFVYANRGGNGDVESGDGWRFSGKGWLQITFRNNVTALAKALGKTVDETVAYLLTDEGGFMGAAWFFSINRLNELADGWQITALSKKVNGGTHGLAERIKFSNALRRALEAAA
jgi:putative chitinase